ncbi:non-hydrolyzing UDP-N-acetylglucosamine 2-epimerase [Geotoga petraea]|jgi:UDP-N-acetylglucosamine 2-epimerase (non-hydrolysing)|uniref:UDP-N-acetylglucosamine 2-epimerase (non-hydrolyzing) n=1 Tax=Geotoga petraea TaxID=28234 RepID=A0A1G6PZX9_9BACT|nr:UDP-N-acetylglucosamine 2-epimerase (non-hydrolyzing) [Geotoga petraea]TGG86833.1 UDP-N-acetylglucosamine 2-epimerase (non-hydrolyzing) [Geotoga petraea]SDC84945.1 UDP-N-acetylglucosamine 2-epimerase (non-hydrolysing) [Geotoga petraea]
MKIAMIFGTRPEAIKMAPLYKQMKKENIEVEIISTGQHKEMLNQVFEIFDIKPDFDLKIMRHDQSLEELSSALINKISPILKQKEYDYIFVHGDTTTTFIASLCGFYSKIPVCHVEAGLRTNDIYYPFPEEMNRKLVGTIAMYHFAPTVLAKDNLLKEGIKEDQILITGNTVVDALNWIIKNKKLEIKNIQKQFGLEDKKYILLTLHRRENQGEVMMKILSGIKKYLSENKEYHLIYPVHLNPNVRKIVKEELQNVERVILTDPLSYIEFVSLMEGSHYIMTDSGGLQEEAPHIGKPVLVLRNETERPEAIRSGVAELVGTDPDKIYKSMKTLNTAKYDDMSESKNPFGDGNASKRITNFIKNKKVNNFLV